LGILAVFRGIPGVFMGILGYSGVLLGIQGYSWVNVWTNTRKQQE
jgi:hypothetical protein